MRAYPDVKDGCVGVCKMEGADYTTGGKQTLNKVPHRGLGQLESSRIMLGHHRE